MPRARCGDIEAAWFEVGRGEPLVLVHGLADDHRAWRKVLPYLVLRYRVLLYDLRGHGLTTIGQPDGSLDQLSHDLIGLLDQLEIDRAHLCGFSLGGTIVIRTAIDQPDRVLKLVPVATSSRVGRSAADWYAERAEMVRTKAPELRGTLEEDTHDVYRNAPDEVGDGWLIRSQSTSDPAGYGNACEAMARLNATPLDPDLGRIVAPTLVVASDLDRLCPPKAGEIIVSGIPGSRLEIIEGAGHPIPVERPEELSSLIVSFLANSED